MLQQLREKSKRLFLPDLIFLLMCVSLVVLGLLFFLLSQLASRYVGVSPTLSITTIVNVPASDSFGTFADAVKTLYQNALEWLNRQGSLLIYTDPKATYDNPVVKQFWSIMLFISDSLLALFLILNGYQIIFGSFSPRYAEAIETLPTLIFAAIGANISLLFARFWIDINNLLCVVLFAQMEDHLLSGIETTTSANITVITLPLIVLLALLLIGLGLEMSVRLGVIIFLTIWLAVLFSLLSHRYTSQFGRAGLTAYPVVVLMQTLQLSCLVVGGKVLLPFLMASLGQTSGAASVAALLASIVLLWVTLRIPIMLRQWVFAPVAESGKAFRLLVVGSIARIVS